MTGGRVTATKPIQADLIIGHVGASFASDWFTLYPVSAWSSAYYTPVGSAAKVSQPAYVYLYNPGSSAITINYKTQVGSGSFSVPGTNGVYQFQMPVGSGASFVSAGGQNFYTLCTVAANNSADTSYNWGFTLVPQSALTTEATVGWGPGSADGTVDGNPVWVTALAGTRLYVDYKGDHTGPLTDPNGNEYDTNFTVTALQTQKIFDPSKNQTGMRVYTVDGTLITAAWGEDPDTAQPGNPYIDAGTTVIPFPTPLLKKTAVIVNDTNPPGLSIGDTIQYTVEIDNKGLLPLGNTVVIDAPSGNLTYVPNSTTLNSNAIPDNLSGVNFPLAAPGYTIPVILSQGVSTFQYLAKVNGAGTVSNSVNIGGTVIYSSALLAPPPTNGASVTLKFSDTNGVPVNLYAAGANVFVTMTNAVGNTSSNSQQSINVTVVDVTGGDLQTITLAETGTNTGVFRNVTGLPTSSTSGLGQQDGTLNVAPGDTLSVSYTDPVYGDSASNTAAILVPTPNKQLYLSATNSAQSLNRVDPVFYGHGPIHTSVDIGSGASGNTGIVGLSNNGLTGVANAVSRVAMTNVFTVAAANNQLMLVGIASRTTQASSVTFSNLNLGHIGYISANTGSGAVDIWALTNPPAWTANVIVNFSAATTVGACFGVTTFTNVNTNAPLGTLATVTGTTANPALTIAATNHGMVYDVVSIDSQTPSATPAAGQTSLFYYSAATTGSGWTSGGASITNGANGNVTMSWTAAAHTWAAAGICIKPVAASGSSGGPATNVTSFVQTPAFALPFTMPAGAVVTITNFITITNGSLASGSAVTATLQTNGVNFLTLTNPVYTAAAGVTNLVWSGVLSTNINILSGAVISYVISNGVAGTAFHVNYDSTNAPSVIVLPASTVIQVNTFGIYDAPYPGGNLVSSPVAGSTVYVRAKVSDPFGSYDISSLGLVVTGPSPGSSFTNTLTDANVVTNDSSSKTYEYQWATGPTTGGYSLAVTAHEGTEGVTATAAASLTTTFLDLGTPSTTEFTGGANGPATNSYTAGSPVSVRVTDLNRNTNAATIDTVRVTVTSSTGDSETLTLVETGVNTGIFTNSIATSTTIVGTANNGTLYATVGSILTASYTDPTDPTDSTSATATVQPAPGTPGVSLSKTIVSPAGGQIGINQPVTYNLQVVNTGSTVLTNVIVTDNFPAGKLNFVSASPAPSSTGSGVLTWNNLGSFAPGQSTNLTVNFTTGATTGTVTNSATANGGTATNTSAVTLLVNQAAVNVTKILLSPAITPVAVGNNVVFRITVQNVGNTVINNLPLEDTFSGAYYQFVSSTITNNGSGAGSLLWTNLAYPTPLATNAIITNDVTMKVVGQGSPANNTAVVDFATDIFGNPVPATASTIGVNTATATINGHVYNDLNQSGVFTNGDAGLSGVTLQLFTDPNGDGDPSDGTLVQLTTTDANGYYELLNLQLGHYVVVATTLPGYVSSAPPNNRLAFNLTTLTINANNNFLQYLPAPSVYSTISGTVWYDANGNGTNDVGETNLANVEIDLVQDVNSNGVADSGEPVAASVMTDTNGNYSLAGITPGHYVIHETDPYGYYSTGDSQGANNNQISFVSTNGIVSTNNNFFDRLSPVAVNDTNSALNFVPVTIYPLTNDLSPNGDALTITSATSTNGIVVINVGSTNLTFTPTNAGTATVTYTIADAHGGTSAAVITVTVTELADLAVGKTASSSVIATGNLTYTISVTNFGPTPANFVVVTDALPAGAIFVSASGSYAINNGVVNWSLGTLTNNQISNLTVTVTAPANGTLTNTASVSSPTVDPNPTNNLTPPVTTTVTPVADVGLGKTAAATVLAAGNLTYTISVTNFGPSIASSVVVTDALPAGVTFVSASGSYASNNGVVNWSLGDLASGQTSNLTLIVTAPASGTLTNVANANSPTGDPNLTNNVTPPVTTTVTPVADLAVTKTGPAGTGYGTNFNYTITVTNFGPSTAAGISVTDSLPAGLIFVSSVPAATSTAGNQIIWSSLGNLAAGAATNLTLTVVSTSSGTVTNIATGGSPTFDPNPTNNTGSPVVTVISKATPVVSWPVPTNIVYGTVLGTNQNDATASVPGTFSYNPTNGVVLPAGTNALHVVFTPTDTNYVAVNVGVLLIVLPAPLTVVANDQVRGYNQVNPALTYTLAGFVNGENSSVVTGVAAVSTVATSTSTVGTYPITIGLGSLAATNYSFSFTNGLLTVTNVPVVVTWPVPTNIVYGTILSTNQNDASASVPGTFSYNPTNGVVLPAGTNALHVVFTPTDTNYLPVNVSVPLIVMPAPLTVAANNQVRGYNQANPPLTYTLAGFVNGENSSVVSGVPSLNTIATPSSPVGVYPITIGPGSLAATNYSFGFTNGVLTVTNVPVLMNWPVPTNIIYGTVLGTNQNDATASVPGTFVYNPTNGTVLPVGTNALQVMFTPTDTNYPAVYLTNTLAVTPAPLTITALNTNKVYGQTVTFAGTEFTTSSLVAGDSVTNVTLVSAGAPGGAAVGSYAIVPGAAAGVGLVNYSITYSNGVLTVGQGTYTTDWPAPTNIIYGTVLGTNHNDATATVPGTFAYNPTNGVILPAGTNMLTTLFTPADTNYPTTYLTNVLVVTPAPLTVAANNAVRGYNQANPPLTYTLAGFVNGENSSVVTGVPAVSTVATSTSPVGTYAITIGPGSLVATNYNFSFTNGVLTVTNVPVVVTWPVPTNIVYGTVLGTNQNDATASVPGTFSYNPTNGVVLPAGTNALHVVFTPTDTNYVAVNASVPLIVLPAPLTVTANDASRQFGQPNPVFSGSITGIQNGDNITATYATTAATNSPAGPYPIIPTLVDPNGRLVNYNITTNNGTLTITNGTSAVDLVVVQSGPASGVAGSNLVYTVSVTNLGPATATGVVVSNQLAAGFSFVSATAAGVNAGGVVTWNIGALPLNGVTNLTVTVFAAEGGSFTNIASGASALTDSNPANNNGSQVNSQSRTVVSALADVAVFKVGDTNGYRGSAISYTITATNAGPSTATNVVVQDNLPAGTVLQSASGNGTNNAGVVTWPAVTLAPRTAATFNVSLVVTSSITAITNIAMSTSPTADPNLANNNGSSGGSRVATKVALAADVVVFMVGPATATQGSNFVYTLTISNAGPSIASNVVASDSLPPGLTFVSTTSGGKATNSLVTWPLIVALPVGAVTNYSLTVQTGNPGLFTNIASAAAATYDPNPTNNSGVSPGSQVQTIVGATQFGVLAGAPVFNPQTGLFEENVAVTNTGTFTVLGFRVHVGGLRSGVTLWNASGTNNGVPYVNYNFPVDPSNGVSLILEFYDPSRLAFTNTLTVEAIQPGPTSTTSTNGSVVVSAEFMDNRILGDPRFVIEFASVPGKTYVVLYSTNVLSPVWNVATPSIPANANITQWYDDGPPKTESSPASVPQRFYRVIQY